MFDIDTIREIWQTISRNKIRSILTGFGVFWGVFILVILCSAGRGIENGLEQMLTGFSTNSAFVSPDMTSVPYEGYPAGRYWNLKNEDVEILKKRVPEIQYIAPVLNNWSGDGSYNVIYGERRGSYNCKGTTADYNQIDRSKILEGRYINDFDIKESRKVCVIGKRVAEELFLQEDPIGKLLKIDGIYYRVVGVIAATNERVNIMGSNSESVVIPITTFQKIYNYGDKIFFMMYVVEDNHPVINYTEAVNTIIKQQHHIAPSDEQALRTHNFYEMFKKFKMMFLGLNILIWIVGLGTLMSGIVGVSNIMLVTVKERTCEIGIRRALGAKPKLIVRQILSESILLTILSGLIGLCSGVGMMALAAPFLENISEEFSMVNPYIGFETAIIATLIIVLSGALAGLLPVKRAMNIKAIDAIREE